MKSPPDWYSRINSAVRSGEVMAAKELAWTFVHENDLGLLRGPEWCLLLELLRRTGQMELALRLGYRHLYRDEYGSLSPQSAVNPGVLAEYAGNLIRVGATSEARKILGQLSSIAEPKVALFQGLSYIHEWDYRSAIFWLKKAGGDEKLDLYQRHVAKINLAQSYIHEGIFEKASTLLSLLRKSTKAKSYRFLYFNALTLSAMNGCFSGRFQESRMILDELQSEYSLSLEGGDYDSLVCLKIWALNELYEKCKMTLLERVRNQGLKFSQPEIARDCDLFLSLHTGYQPSLSQVYFSSPFPGYRQRVERLGKERGMLVPDIFYEGTLKNLKQIEWDPVNDSRLKPNQNISKFILLLLSEKYRRFPTMELAAKLFTDRVLNFSTCPVRVHQLVKRVRKFLGENRIGLSLRSSSQGFYFDRASPQVIIHHKISQPENPLLMRLKLNFSSNPFTGSEGRSVLSLSQQRFSSSLGEFIASGKVLKVGGARNTRYSIV